MNEALTNSSWDFQLRKAHEELKNDVAKQVSKQQNQVLLVLVLPHSHFHNTDFTNNLFQKPFFNYAQMSEALFFILNVPLLQI